MRREILPDGKWVDLRDKADMLVKHRRAVNSAAIHALPAINKLPKNLPTDGTPLTLADLEQTDMATLGLTVKEADSLQEAQEAVVWSQLAAWEYDDPIPATPADVSEMNGDRLEAIQQLTKVTGAALIEGVDFAPPKEGPISKPGNPTGRLANSATRS
jgi:hypothetical protein